LVSDVSDQAVSSTWVCLDIDALYWLFKPDVSENDILDAGSSVSRRYGTNAHSNSIFDVTVFYEDVLSAVRTPVAPVRGLWNHGVIKVGDVKSSESRVSAVEIDTIRVKWEGRKRNGEIMAH
jgi:hypothetical protein